ncbi:MAG: spermidine/putrescine ABC transporter permease PotC [Thermodesulfobacteriota bacterium]
MGIKILKRAYMAFIYAFLYVPIVVLVVLSFNQSKFSTHWAGFTTGWYGKLLHNDLLLDAAKNSLLVALSSATLASALGVLGAFALYRYRFLGKRMLYGLLYVLMISPDVVMGISLLILFTAVRLPLGYLSLLLAHVTLCLPFVTVVVYSRLSQLSPHILEAARDLGASEYAALRLVILPLIAPAVLAGWLLSFTLSLDDVIISFFVTGPSFEILPLRIYSMVRLGVKPEVNALCTVIFAASLALVTASQLLLKEEHS